MDLHQNLIHLVFKYSDHQSNLNLIKCGLRNCTVNQYKNFLFAHINIDTLNEFYEINNKIEQKINSIWNLLDKDCIHYLTKNQINNKNLMFKFLINKNME